MNTLHILLVLSWALIVVSIVMSIRFIQIQKGLYTEYVQLLIQKERESCARVFDEMADKAEVDCEPSERVLSLRKEARLIRIGLYAADIGGNK